jgi:hypothetical protein
MLTVRDVQLPSRSTTRPTVAMPVSPHASSADTTLEWHVRFDGASRFRGIFQGKALILLAPFAEKILCCA